MTLRVYRVSGIVTVQEDGREVDRSWTWHTAAQHDVRAEELARIYARHNQFSWKRIESAAPLQDGEKHIYLHLLDATPAHIDADRRVKDLESVCRRMVGMTKEYAEGKDALKSLMLQDLQTIHHELSSIVPPKEVVNGPKEESESTPIKVGQSSGGAEHQGE